MSLIKWTPFIEPSWLEEFDRTFDGNSLTKGFTPALDVYQTKDSVVVEAPLAGIDPEKINIAIENDILNIKGEQEKKSEVEDKNYYRREVRFGSFYRSIQLPAHVLGDKASAEYEKGVLKITIPKAPEAKPKTIKINVIKNK